MPNLFDALLVLLEPFDIQSEIQGAHLKSTVRGAWSRDNYPLPLPVPNSSCMLPELYHRDFTMRTCEGCIQGTDLRASSG